MSNKKGRFDVRKPIKELRSKVDSRDILNYQVKGPRRYPRSMPEGLLTNEDLQKLLLRVFPKLQTDQNQRIKAGRWAHIFYLFYRAGHSKKEIAEELGISRNAVKGVINRIKWSLHGLETHSLKVRKR